MSKQTFAHSASDLMYKKIKAFEYLEPSLFFEKDDDFELLLCLAYMTLSKEKIIKKELKNPDRMGRLTKMVDMKEIDKVFSPGFSTRLPIINYAKENNNLWILDNIRDSIMHSMFEIDEENRNFIIKNDYYDRDLDAIVPFEWFIAYAKNDILSKKMLDDYVVRGFYYNKDKKQKSAFLAKREVGSHILYNVRVSGGPFNVTDVHNRVRELFDRLSFAEFSDEELDEYISMINPDKNIYDERYLASFYINSTKVKETIEREFPGVNVNIFIEGRKHKISNKIFKKYPYRYTNYDLMFNDFNNAVSSKGNMLLRYLSNIIENIGCVGELDYSKLTVPEVMNIFNIMLDKRAMKFTDDEDIKQMYSETKKVLRSLCLSVYGLSTLVINHEGLYSSHFLGQSPGQYGIVAYSKSKYLEYCNAEKRLIMTILDLEIKLFPKLSQLEQCKNENARIKLQADVDELNRQKTSAQNDLLDLRATMKFEPLIKRELMGKDDDPHCYDKKLDEYYSHFFKAKTAKGKKKVKKVISSLLEQKYKETSKYTFAQCYDMKDVLEIIRNSLSHMGRIYIGKDRTTDTFVVLNDYENNGGKSGEVLSTYMGIINLLRDPYYGSVSRRLIQ